MLERSASISLCSAVSGFDPLSFDSSASFEETFLNKLMNDELVMFCICWVVVVVVVVVARSHFVYWATTLHRNWDAFHSNVSEWCPVVLSPNYVKQRIQLKQVTISSHTLVLPRLKTFEVFSCLGKAGA